jgi:hypothetical protein
MADVAEGTGGGMIHGLYSRPAQMPQAQVAGLIQHATGYFDQVIVESRRMAGG